jgi:putative selenium metabolism protein SsnA
MLIIGNGNVITRDPARPYVENGAVVIEKGRIAAVDSTRDLREKFSDAEYVNAKGGLIMPGFINTHEHIYSAMARGLSIKGYHPKGFLEILDGQWWNIDRHLTMEQIKYSAMDTIISCIRNGVTTMFDHHASFGCIKGSLFTIADVAKNMGVRACLCYEISDRDGMEKARESVMENAEFIRYALRDDTDMTAGMMGMHAQFTISDATMELAAAQKPKEAGYHIHVAEGIEDLHDCLKKYGKRIVDRLMDWDILGEETLLGHCIYINRHEMDLIKDTNTMVVHNPESNMGNACGCPPTMELVKRGIVTGLGTDGYTHDMTESYKVANVLHKHNLCDANAAWTEVPLMLFENNKTIANRYFKTPLGVLKEGAAGDVIVVDYDPPTPLDETNINGHILFGMTGRDVVTTICSGKILMQDREVKVADTREVMAKCREESAKLWKSING